MVKVKIDAMKVCKIAVLLCVLSSVGTISNFFDATTRQDLFALALSSIIRKFYVKQSNNVFVTSNKSDAVHNLILQNLFASIDRNLLITWILHDQDYLNGNIDRMSNIIFIDSYQSFRLILETITTTSLDCFGYYIIVKTNSGDGQNQESDLTNILRHLWHNNIVNVNILTYSDASRRSVLVHTYFPFSPTHCGKIEPLIWNSFENGHFVQTNKQIFPLKTKNLFQCPISLLVAPYRPYIIIAGNNSHGSPRLAGPEYVLLQEISKQINFKLNISIYRDPAIGALHYNNGTAGGAFGMIFERKYDMLVGALIYSPFLKTIISTTTAYSHENLKLVVPFARHYSSFETLFFPFTVTAWMCIAMALMVAVAVIKLLQWDGKYYALVVGANNTSPYLNLLHVLLTAGSLNNPGDSFARFLLMVWVLTCIILQTVYQGQLFTFIKMNKMVPSVTNIDELIHNGITIKLIEDDFGPFLKFDTRLKELLKFVDPTTDWEYVTETEAYVAFQTRLADDTERKIRENRIERLPKAITIASYTHIICVTKRFYLKEAIDEQISNMDENGFMFKWGVSISSDTQMVEDIDGNIPRRLHISQILGMVQAWLGLLLLSTIIFILEKMSCRNTAISEGI